MQLHWGSQPTLWQDTIARIPQATFFHTPAWAEVFVTAKGGRVEVLHACWPDGRQALVPVGVRPIWWGLVQSATTGIDGGYGGILATAPLSTTEEQQLYRAVRQRFPELALASNPFDAVARPLPGGSQAAAGHTYAVCLAPLPELRRQYTKERQRTVRRYQEAGVQVRLIPRPDEADRRHFYRLYEQAAAQWREQEHPERWIRDRRWFETLWTKARDHLTLAVGTVDGEVAGMEIVAVQGRIATELFHVWDRRFGRQHVSTAIVEACLAFSHARGCDYLDAVPSGPLDSLDRFKASFGASARPIWADSQTTPLTRALLHGQALWQHCQTLASSLVSVPNDRLVLDPPFTG
ncbi:MAG: GNAT family N-acetyltransferase [Candidatus Sericytochromatia bacterium]|nr:GNAT family N-acetyltransferase [Candidatus Sericytochromatia bacterium]